MDQKAAAVYLLIQIIAFSHEFICGFDDSAEFPDAVPFAVDPHEAFRWQNGRIPFFFNEDVTRNDKNLILEAMKQIEDQTCFRFEENNQEPNEHHLELFVGPDSCLIPFSGIPRISGFVHSAFFRKQNKIALQSNYQLADSTNCNDTSIGLMLHELMHVVGVVHTQTRKDRDEYITVNWDNIRDDFLDQYEICYGCIDFEVGYDCSSIMHYGYDLGSAPTMTAKNPQKCRLSREGAAEDGRGASQSDWELLRKISNEFCSRSPRVLDEPDSGVCRTSGGAADAGTACVFPFTFRDVTHIQCTYTASDDGVPWCSTKTDRRGDHIGGRGFWGTCTSSCPTEEFQVQIDPEAQDDSTDNINYD